MQEREADRRLDRGNAQTGAYCCLDMPQASPIAYRLR
jgi:hypothetical protein